MTELLEQFKRYLEEEGKSQNTIKSYLRHAEGYLKWFQDTFNKEMTKLYRENVLEFKSYLINIKKQNAKTINAKLSALIQFNFFLQDRGVQDDIVLSKKDVIKIQNTVASPSTVTRAEVESFRQ